MSKTVVTDKRLFRTNANGVRVLAYPAGAHVPADEYDELAGKKAEPVEAPKSLSKMNLEELKAVVAEEGVDIGDATTKAEIVDAIKAHRDKPADPPQE